MQAIARLRAAARDDGSSPNRAPRQSRLSTSLNDAAKRRSRSLSTSRHSSLTSSASPASGGAAEAVPATRKSAPPRRSTRQPKRKVHSTGATRKDRMFSDKYWQVRTLHAPDQLRCEVSDGCASHGPGHLEHDGLEADRANIALLFSTAQYVSAQLQRRREWTVLAEPAALQGQRRRQPTPGEAGQAVANIQNTARSRNAQARAYRDHDLFHPLLMHLPHEGRKAFHGERLDIGRLVIDQLEQTLAHLPFAI